MIGGREERSRIEEEDEGEFEQGINNK